MKKVLFLCTGNSCRSQMAEGWGRHFHQDIEFYSAGVKTHGLNPKAVQVMNEVSVDISKQKSELLEEAISDITELDLVITVCSDAHETCPYVPGVKIVHQGFEDPPRLTKDLEDEDEVLDVYRRVRDEIRDFVKVDLLKIIADS